MYEEDVPPKEEGGFPGKLCHYRFTSVPGLTFATGFS